LAEAAPAAGAAARMFAAASPASRVIGAGAGAGAGAPGWNVDVSAIHFGGGTDAPCGGGAHAAAVASVNVHAAANSRIMSSPP
jgi:hypothetical protein